MPAAISDRPLDLTPRRPASRPCGGSGDYSAVAARIAPISEWLCDAADVRAGDVVLDVGTGSGSTAIAAARCGATADRDRRRGLLLDRARIRATAEGFQNIDLVLADAEDLPFDDALFDVVVSVVGVMFAPDQDAPPPSWCASPGPAGPSPWPTGPRTASSATC